MKKISVLTAILICLSFIPACATGKTDDYNLRKAYEVLKKNNDTNEAISLLDKQLEETPDNVEALFLRAKLLRRKEDYSSAFRDINHALKVNRPKKSEIFNSTLHWSKSILYSLTGDREGEVAELRTALALARKDCKENVQSISFDLAQALYYLDRYDESDAVYRDMVKADEADQTAMTGLARNMIAREEYAAAAELLEKVKTYDAEYPGSYQFAMRAYDKMGNTDKAIDNAICLFEKDSDSFSVEMVDILLKHKTYAVAKIQERMKSSEDPAEWKVLLIATHEGAGEYEKALALYDELEHDYGKDPWIYVNRGRCLASLGLNEKALSELDKALGDDYDEEILAEKANIYRCEGRYGEAIELCDRYIDEEPASAYGYYAKGWCYELSGDDDSAMEMYELGIDLDKTYPYIFLMRGEQFLRRGETEKARADFETILSMDTLAVDGSCRQYALHFLGHDEEARGWMDRIIEDDPFDSGNWYDKACLYSQMGLGDEAVAALRKALEMGFCSFGHIEHDDDLDAVRDREDFKAVVGTYKEKLQERTRAFDDRSGEQKGSLITEVSISRHSGGTFEIPCSVNGLNLNMLFDTGASDVTISSVEANFMLKNDYLSSSDVKGRKYYQIANGDLTEGTVVTLKEVKVGDAVLRNVDASVVKSQKAPLLLGQSVMERFGTITIDNINSKLVIRQ